MNLFSYQIGENIRKLKLALQQNREMNEKRRTSMMLVFNHQQQKEKKNESADGG